MHTVERASYPLLGWAPPTLPPWEGEDADGSWTGDANGVPVAGARNSAPSAVSDKQSGDGNSEKEPKDKPEKKRKKKKKKKKKTKAKSE